MPPYCMRILRVITLCLALVFNAFLVQPLAPTFASGVYSAMNLTSQVDGLSPSAQCGSWNLIPGPTSSTSIYSFLATSALSPSDIWAVGAAVNMSFDHTNFPLAAHWDGSSWSVTQSPDGYENYALRAVTALSTNDVWAVGGVEGEDALIEHWDGSMWSVAPGPVVSAVLYDITQVPNSHQLWAVGDHDGNQPFIEHWDGASWSVVPAPAPGVYSSLSSVTAITDNDAWAVGTYKRTINSSPRTLTEHWNGSTWSIVPGPNLRHGGWFEKVIAVPGSHRLWAVGNQTTDPSTGSDRTLIEYWNGVGWSILSSPNQTPDGNTTANTLTGVAALSASNIWAVGFYQSVNGSYTSPAHPIIEHWDGISWSMVSGADLSGQNILSGITKVPQTRELWAIGAGVLNNNYQSFAESYQGTHQC